MKNCGLVKEAVILAAGKGSRLNAAGTNKALEPIGAKPLICFGIDALIDCGIKLIWIVRYYKDSFDSLDLLYREKKVDLRYIDEYEHVGSLHSFALIQKYVSSRFLVLDCDLIIKSEDFAQMLQQGIRKMYNENLFGVMAFVCNPCKEDTDMLIVEKGKVKRFIKEGGGDSKRGGYIFLWTPEVFCDTELFLGEKIYSLSRYYDYLVQKYDIGLMEIDNVWDVDTMDDIRFTLDWIQENIEDGKNE